MVERLAPASPTRSAQAQVKHTIEALEAQRCVRHRARRSLPLRQPMPDPE